MAMRMKTVTALLGLVAAGCGWPFNTDATCTERGLHADCSMDPLDAGAGGMSSGGESGSGGAGTGGTAGDAGTGGSGGASGTGGTGGSSDGGQDVDATPPCDPTALPSEATCVIDEKYGVFVSPSGSDTLGDGSRKLPYATLSQAMSAVAADKRRIYACADGGTYADTINIGTSLDGLSFFGGFHCRGWAYDSTLKAKVVSTNATAWTVTGLTKGLTIEDFDITAADATASSASSIAMTVVNSANVVLRRVTVTAGKGANGTKGTDGSRGKTEQTETRSHLTKPARTRCVRVRRRNNSVGRGRRARVGRRAAVEAPPRFQWARREPLGARTRTLRPSALAEAVRQQRQAAQMAATGSDGASGNDGTVGSVAADAGTFTVSGFTPADGADGVDGYPGQGGGGGGASRGSATCVGASGGAGGMGGCGGGLGTGGKGGGASVALFAWQSVVTLDDVTLVAAKGGDGGAGGNSGPGGNGQGGALGGSGDGGGGIGRGGGGGAGGNGGRGGAGSGGTGGPSYPLVYSNGKAPTKTKGVLNQAQGGAKGAGGFVNGFPGTNQAQDGTAGAQAGEFIVQ